MIQTKILREIVRIEQLYIRGSGYYELENFNLMICESQFVFLCEPEGYGGKALADVFLGRKPVFSGKIFLEGRPVMPEKEISYEKEGIYVISEDESMQPYMSVEENLFLSWKPELFRPWFMKKSLRASAQRLLQKLEIQIHPGTCVRDLSFEDRQLLKFARAYCKRARLVVINGVMDVISEKRQRQLMKIIGIMRQEHMAVICISHKFLELALWADLMVLIKNGTKIWTMFGPEIDIEKALHIYDSKSARFKKVQPLPCGRIFMEIYRNHQCVFEARGGRCIGICAQEREMLDTFISLLTGNCTVPGVDVYVSGKRFVPAGYTYSVKAGIAKADIQSLKNNFSQNLNLEENLYLPDMQKLKVGGLFKNPRYEKFLKNEYCTARTAGKVSLMADQRLWDMLFVRLIYASAHMILFAGTLPANFGEANAAYIQKLIEREKILVFFSVSDTELRTFCHEVYHCEYVLP